MTGYGRGVAEHHGFRAIVEIRAVNHRFLDLKLRGASLAPAVEDSVSRAIRVACKRGSVTAVIRLDNRGARTAMRVDMDAARHVHAELSRLSAVIGDAHITAELLCAQPGVLVAQDPDASATESAASIEAAVERALAQLADMREAEGARLAEDLRARRERLGELVIALDRIAASQPEQLQERITERLRRLLQKNQVELNESRLLQEVAVLADRIDVTEELVRLRSHLDQMDEIMTDAQGPIGRQLEFLAQEIAREFNTIAAKSQSPDASRHVVEAKAELEKVREQVQNIE